MLNISYIQDLTDSNNSHWHHWKWLSFIRTSSESNVLKAVNDNIAYIHLSFPVVHTNTSDRNSHLFLQNQTPACVLCAAGWIVIYEIFSGKMGSALFIWALATNMFSKFLAENFAGKLVLQTNASALISAKFVRQKKLINIYVENYFLGGHLYTRARTLLRNFQENIFRERRSTLVCRSVVCTVVCSIRI